MVAALRHKHSAACGYCGVLTADVGGSHGGGLGGGLGCVDVPGRHVEITVYGEGEVAELDRRSRGRSPCVG